MITIEVDEGYAYDMLSILAVKQRKQLDSPVARANYARLDSALRTQIAQHVEVKDSDEYIELINVNYHLFTRIDEYKRRGEQLGDAGCIDQLNYQRFLAKQALQSRFFPSSPLSEQKLGYDQTPQSTPTLNGN